MVYSVSKLGFFGGKMRTNLSYINITSEIRRVRDSIGTLEKYYTRIFNKKTPEKPRKIHIVNIFNILNLKDEKVDNDYFFSCDDLKVFTSAKLLLTPSKPKKLPELPKKPDSYYSSHNKSHYDDIYNECAKKIKALECHIRSFIDEDKNEADKVMSSYLASDSSAIECIASLAITRNPLHNQFHLNADTVYDANNRILLATINIPNFRDLLIYKTTSTGKETNVTQKEWKVATEHIIYALCIRAAYLISVCDSVNAIDTVAVNAKQEWNDAVTGRLCEGIVASFQAIKEKLAQIELSSIDAKTCFRHFGGIATPSVERITPIRPIFTLNKEDSRHVQARDVDESLDENTNLAAMPWEDFEHLVRQLFEWEFGSNGVEVKVTRASRDRGVDAIMYDPDPLRGGKFILQAKRYTRTVDVAAVRDLYGTVINEGANRGILVTTSSYGPDTYDFAKDKPISLVDGPSLIQILSRHGRRYRIDLEEARKLESFLDRT